MAILLGGFALGQPRPDAPPARPAGVRFAAVDVYVDSGNQPLAAWQFELSARRGRFTIVGVEGGEHPAFHEAPYYDPAALQRGRIIVAAFSTGNDIPRGRTRVATVHVMIEGGETPDYGIEIAAAASKEGEAIQAEIRAIEGKR